MTKRASLITLLVIILLSSTAFGQQTRNSSDTLPADSAPPSIMFLDSLFNAVFNKYTLPDETTEQLHPLEWDNVFQDEMISFLLHAHRDAMMERLGIPGFRVHLYMDSGNRARLNTQMEQAEFEEQYPDQAAYIVYEEPYFKLRVGDFRTRLDARRFLEKIKRDYPAAYIVVDLINYPEMN